MSGHLDGLPVETVPEGFLFSQSNLQDYVDCPRRFQLRWLMKFAWPAVQVEPVLDHERFIQAGTAFHRLAHQRFSGIPSVLIRSSINDLELLSWWDKLESFIVQTGLDHYPGLRPEVTLSAPINLDDPDRFGLRSGSYRLAAKYDLLAPPAPAGDDGQSGSERKRFRIYDWKTTRRRSGRFVLAERLQTRVYPYLLVRAGAEISGGRMVEPGSVEMIYWFSSPGDDPIRFPYSPSQYQADQVYLVELITEITMAERDGFPMTADQSRCAYCVYRSLCERGGKAGRSGEQDEDEEENEDDLTHFDFEGIAEIEF